jgi:hypothetical protein
VPTINFRTWRTLLGTQMRVVQQCQEDAESHLTDFKHMMAGQLHIRPTRQSVDGLREHHRIVLPGSDKVLILLVEMHRAIKSRETYLTFQHKGTVFGDELEGATPDKYVLTSDRVLHFLRARAGAVPSLGETAAEIGPQLVK